MRNKMILNSASFVNIVQAKLGQASTGDNNIQINDETCPGVGLNSDPANKSPVCHLWTTVSTKRPDEKPF